MEITKLNIISDFVSPLPKVPQVYTSFWKWGALILAIVATFTGIITRIKLFIIRVHSIKHSSSSQQLLQQLDHDENFDCTDDGDRSSSLTDADENEEIFKSINSFDDQTPNYQFDEDFCVAGSSFCRDNRLRNSSSKLRRRGSGCDFFSWSEFGAGKSVVKLWDSFGVGLDFQDSYGSEISIWDLGKDEKVSSFFGGKQQIPAVAMSSPAVVHLAEMSDGDRVVLGTYDRRMGVQIPAMLSEWGPRRERVVSVSSGGVEKVYVKCSVSGGACTVGDMRNVRTPLENLKESDMDTCWNADG